MEHVTDINKDQYIETSMRIVKDVLLTQAIDLSDEELEILTKEIMDTSLMMGGDFSRTNIQEVTQQYLEQSFLDRFKRAHRG